MRTLADLRRWAQDAPPGTSIPAAALVEVLDELEEASPGPAELTDVEPASWRQRIWTVAADTRLGVVEVAEALGRPKSYVYARTGERADDPLPCRKLDGTLVFLAGELRAWIEEREEIVHRGVSTRGLRVS